MTPVLGEILTAGNSEDSLAVAFKKGRMTIDHVRHELYMKTVKFSFTMAP